MDFDKNPKDKPLLHICNSGLRTLDFDKNPKGRGYLYSLSCSLGTLEFNKTPKGSILDVYARICLKTLLICKNPKVWATCRSLIDDRKNWVIDTCYIPLPKEANRKYSDWGNIPMLNWGQAEVIAWMKQDIPEPYEGE